MPGPAVHAAEAARRVGACYPGSGRRPALRALTLGSKGISGHPRPAGVPRISLPGRYFESTGWARAAPPLRAHPNFAVPRVADLVRNRRQLPDYPPTILISKSRKRPS
jgi:hypothetical protein